MRQFWAKLEPASKWNAAETGFVVTFPGIDEVITQGENEADALDMAHDALLTMLAGRMKNKKPLFAENRKSRSLHAVGLSTMESLKCDLYEAMRQQGISQKELAQKLGVGNTQIGRLLNLAHTSHWLQLEAALNAVGLRVIARVVAA
jgi:antitoxin HicB